MSVFAEISFGNGKKSLTKLPLTLEALHEEVQKLYKDKLPKKWIIEYAADRTKKPLDQEEYENILATPDGEVKEFFIKELPEIIDDQNSISETQSVNTRPNQKKNFETLFKDLSEIDDDVEEAKRDEEKDQTPNARGVRISDEIKAWKKELKEGLEDNDLKTFEDLLEAIEFKRNEYNNYQRNGKKNNATKALTKIQELEHLQKLFAKIKFSEKPLNLSSELAGLEKELNEGLEENDLTTFDGLIEEIEAKRKEYDNYLKNGRKNNAAQALAKVQELEHLQELFAKIKVLKNPAGDLAQLEEELKEGLENNDLTTLEGLIEEIQAKRKEFENHQRNGKKNNAAQTLTKVQELEHLQELFAKIKALKQSGDTKIGPSELEEELKKGLEENDLTTLEGLIEETETKRKEYDSYLKNGRKNNAAQALAKIQELEHLQVLFAKIGASKQSAGAPKGLAELEEEFKQGLENNDLIDFEGLVKELEAKRKEYDNYQRNGRKNNAAQALVKIEELENLERLFAAIQSQRQVKTQSSPESPDVAAIAEQEQVNDADSNYREALRTKSLYENTTLMPNCAEKSLMTLIYHCSLKALNEESLESSKLIKPRNLDKEILQEFENLKERVKIEDNYISNIENKLQKWKAKLVAGDFESLKSELTLTLDDLRPLDIQELLKLLKEGEKTSDLIKNEDVFLLLGGTGCGKSTTIHFFAGSEMARDGEHIYPVKIMNPAVKNVVTSSASKSETRYISAIPVELSKLDPIYDGRVLLCDTPGFGDTAGAEVDIANAISIYRAVSKCKSVKPVLLISYKANGDRMQGLKQLAHILVGMIPEIKKYKNSVAYLFTKYPKENQATINPSLVKLRNELNEQEKADEGFITLFNDMIKKTRNKPVFIDPIGGKPGDILDDMLSSDKIPRPGSVFKSSINEESKGVLLNQVHKNQQSIISAAKRSDYELAEYKLNELKRLSEELDMESIRKAYNQCISDLGKHFEEQYDLATAPIGKCLIEGNILMDGEVERYQMCIKNAQSADRLRDLYLDKEVVRSDAYTNYLNEKIDFMMIGFGDKSLDDSSLKASLDKARLLASSFEHVEGKYKEACSKISEIFKASIEDLKKLYLKHKYEESGLVLTQIQKAMTSYENHINKENMLEEYEKLKAEMKNSLAKLVKEIEPNFSKEQLTEKGIEDLKTCIERLDAVKNSASIQLHFSQKDLNTIYTDVINLAVKYVKGIVKRVGELLDAKKERSLGKVEAFVQEMSIIKEIAGLETTVELFYSTFSKITDYILSLKVDILNELGKVSQENQKINYQKIYNYLVELETAQWISKYKDNVYTDLMETVEEGVFEQFKILKDDLDKIQINLENAGNIKIAYQKISKIEEMRSFEKIFKELTGQRERIEELFNNKVNHLFGRIEDLIPQCEVLKDLSFKIERVKKANDFLEVCKTISQFDSRASDLLDKLQECLRKCNSNVNEELKRAFQVIEEYVESIENGISPSYEDIASNGSIKLLETEGNANSSLEESIIVIEEDKNKKIKKYIEEKIRLISTNLQDLENISHYPSIYKNFNAKMLKEYENRIEKNLRDMADKMKEMIAGGNHVDLSSSIQIARALSELDQFLTLESSEKFRSIAIDYHTQLVEDTKQKKDDIIDKIKTFNFEEVKEFMDDLDNGKEALFQRQLQRVKVLLSYTIQNLLEETQNKVGGIRWKDQDSARVKVKEVIQNLKHIQKARDNVSRYLEDGTTKLDRCKTDVIEQLSNSLLHYLNTISKQIAGQSFSKEIGEKIEYAEEMKDLVGKFFLDAKVENKIKSFENVEMKTLKKIERKFLLLEITDYALNQPKAFLEKFEGKSQIQHENLKKTIERRVHEVFERELESARTSRPISVALKHLKNVEFALESLPETLKANFKQKFRECKENIENIKIRFAEEFLELNQKRDLNTYRKLIRKCQEMEETSRLSEIEQCVEGDLGQIHSEIKHIVIRQLEDIQEDILKVIDYVAQLSSVFPRLCDFWSGVETTLSNHLKRLETNFDNKLRFPVICQDDPQRLQISFNDFLAYAKLILRLGDSARGQEPFLQPLLNETLEKLRKTNVNMHVKFLDFERQYKEAFERFDMKDLATVLKRAQEWEPLIVLIREADDNIKKEFFYTLDAGKDINVVKIKAKVQEMFKQLIDKENDLSFINSQTRGFASSRENYYIELQGKLRIIEDAKEALPDMDMGFQMFYDEIIRIIHQQKASLYEAACSRLLKMWTEKVENLRENCEQFSLNYSNLLSVQAFLNVSKSTTDFYIQKIEATWKTEFSSYTNKIETNSSNLEKYTNQLKVIKTLAAYIEPFKDRIDAKLNDILEAFKSKQGGAQAITKLGALLNSDKAGIGQRIIDEHSIFQGYSLSLFNTKTQKHGIFYVLDNLFGDALEKDHEGVCIEKELLRERFEEYEGFYKDLIRRNLKRNIDLSPIISNVKILAENIVQKPDKLIWDLHISAKIPQLIAHIFAIWTLKNAGHYFEVENLESKNSYLLQPHAAQVISIFRLLGVGAQPEKLQNNLVQIGTGEGKSITLAVAAAVLALLGFEVSCACYSQYLCDRDYGAFRQLFDLLGLTEHIHYGTFNKLCEDALNQNGEIRKIVDTLISKGMKDAVLMNKEFGRSRILLIDEVDVFFSKHFYGELYTPSVNIRGEPITQLLDWIWSKKNTPLSLNSVKASPEYWNCLKWFKEYGFLVEEAVKAMLFDLREFPFHQYIVKADKIGYIDGDAVSFQAVNRYQTVFAYYLEHERGKISKKSLEENKWIRIVCGNFSYAEIPKQFSYIMGVTGTLQTLTKPERSVIEETYGIRKNTYTPSVFGEQRFKFKPYKNVHIESEQEYYARIAAEISKKLRKNSKFRAVLVFFESTQKLKDCLAAPALGKFRDRIICLTEEANRREKESVIKRATCSGQVTFLTRTFGRGTDFVVNDQEVAAGGGLHVIQTFVSEESSEEVQIKGRTARQGDKGSFSMVLLESSLEKFLVFKEDLKDVENGATIFSRIYRLLKGAQIYNTKYDLINERRNEHFESQYEERQKYVSEAQAYHEEAVEFMNNIKGQNVEHVKEFLLLKNKGAAEVVKSKTIVLMDATGSMSNLLLKSKITVRMMFERVCGILKESNISEDSFQLQFTVFRNYGNDENHLLQSSIWETRPDNLRSFMEKVHTSGGLGNEAIEIGLWHANIEHQKHKISQVILIGDAPANTMEELCRKREIKGEKYWSKTRFAKKTFWMEEAEKLKNNNIPVHAFYVNERAQANFTEIAAMTQGRCQFLDVNSIAGADLLTNLVSEVLLGNIGQQNGKGDDLVQAYRRKFMKSYS